MNEETKEGPQLDKLIVMGLRVNDITLEQVNKLFVDLVKMDGFNLSYLSNGDSEKSYKDNEPLNHLFNKEELLKIEVGVRGLEYPYSASYKKTKKELRGTDRKPHTEIFNRAVNVSLIYYPGIDISSGTLKINLSINMDLNPLEWNHRSTWDLDDGTLLERATQAIARVNALI